MNKFDEFIEATDKDLKVDTSTRVASGSVTPPEILSPSRSVSGGSVFRKRDGSSTEGTKTFGHSRQFTPQRLSHQDHPLKDTVVQSVHAPVAARSNNGFSKRRSLIQPIVAPKTPESSAKFNVSAPTTLLAERPSYAGRKRSGSNTSAASTADDDVSILLQSLANKESEILDTKKRMEDLKKQLASEDVLYHERLKDLQELKDKVSDHFQKTANNNISPTIDKTRRDIKETESVKIRSPSKKATPEPVEHPAKENRRSVWSKPLAIFNQFDQIIQHELERSLNWDEQPSPASPKPPKDGRLEANAAVRPKRPSEEPVGVTKSLWNFVSDMKSGLLGIDEESDKSQNNSHSIESEGLAGLGLNYFDSTTAGHPAVNDNKLKFVGGELKAQEEGEVSKEVEMKEL